MHKIGDDTPTADGNGEFKETPTTTDLRAGWANTIQRELVKIVQWCGLTLSTADDDQIQKGLGGKIYGRAAHVPLLADTLGLSYRPGRKDLIAIGADAMCFDGTHIWLRPGGGDIQKINILTHQVDATIPYAIGSANGFAFDGSHVWMSVYTGGTAQDAVKINIETNTIDATVTCGSQQAGVTYASGHVWVCNTLDDTVSKIDITTDTVVATIAVGNAPYYSAFDGTHLWVCNWLDTVITKINVSDNSTTTIAATAFFPAFDGTHMWCSDNSENLIKINVETGVIDNTLVFAGEQLKGVAFDGRYIWSKATTKVRKIDIHSDTVIATYNLSNNQSGIVFDGVHMWVTATSAIKKYIAR